MGRQWWRGDSRTQWRTGKATWLPRGTGWDRRCGSEIQRHSSGCSRRKINWSYTTAMPILHFWYRNRRGRPESTPQWVADWVYGANCLYAYWQHPTDTKWKNQSEGIANSQDGDRRNRTSCKWRRRDDSWTGEKAIEDRWTWCNHQSGVCWPKFSCCNAYQC